MLVEPMKNNFSYPSKNGKITIDEELIKKVIKEICEDLIFSLISFEINENNKLFIKVESKLKPDPPYFNPVKLSLIKINQQLEELTSLIVSNFNIPTPTIIYKDNN